MAKIAQQFEKAAGEFGLLVITETGWCKPLDAADVEGNCTKRYKLVALPNSAGAIMKVLDGSNAMITEVQMLTDGQTYQCVKVHGETQPLAPLQDGGWADGVAALEYKIIYQEVGGVN